MDAATQESLGEQSAGPTAPAAADVWFAVSPQVRRARDDDGLVILDIESGEYSTFNPVGGLVWTQLEEGSSAGAIIRDLQARFDEVPDEVIERDVGAILENLESGGLIARRGEAPAAPEYLEPPPPSLAPGTASGAGEGEAGDGGGFGSRVLWNLVSLVTLVYIDLLMRLFRFPRLYAAVHDRRLTVQRAAPATVERICRSMDWAATAYFKKAWCLQRSAACVYLLRRLGCPADLALGVRVFPFEAHAWAELGGEVINDTVDYVGRFIVLDRI